MLPRIHAGILDAEIPFGGYGRSLTGEECSELNREGIPRTDRHIVVRTALRTPRLERLYEPTYTTDRRAPMELLVS